MLNLMVVFNTEKKPFDDVRVRQALLHGDRPLGRLGGLSKISTLSSVGGVMRPGYATGDAGGRARQAAGLRQGHQQVARGGQEAARARPACQDLKFKLLNRNVAMPYTPAGIFLIDQWRQIGVDGRARAARDQALPRGHDSRQLRRGDRLPARFMDDPSLQLCKYLSTDACAEQLLALTTTPSSTSCTTSSCASSIRRSAQALIREFEKRLLEQAYNVPLLWWHRIVRPTRMMGWYMTPSHYLGQDLPTSGSISSDMRSARWPLAPLVPGVAGRQFPNAPLYCQPPPALVIPTLLGVAILVFFLMRVMPGDVVEVKLRGDGGAVSQETIEAERKRLGLDKPLIDAVRRLDGRRSRPLDLGKSMWTGGRSSRRSPSGSRCRSRSRSWRRSSRC